MTIDSGKFRALRWMALICAALIASPLAIAGQASQPQEDEVQKLLAQADAYLQKGDYKLAIGSYLEAAALSQSKPSLSRAYFGLALDYFYLRDMANSVKWMRKVSEVDPNKEISELFYPKGFTQLFNQVQKERREKLPIAGGEETGRKEVPAKAAEENKPIQQEAKKEEAPPDAAAKPPGRQPAVAAEMTQPIQPAKGGHWEVEAHYSMWGLDLIKGLFEKSLTDRLGEEVQNELVKQVENLHGILVQSSYTQELTLDASGSNYGLGIRYYSRGRAGTFSFGLSFEKTTIKLAVAGKARQDFTNGSYAAANAEAMITTSPFTTNFSFRWDFNSGRMVTPYFVLGFGISSLDGEYSYAWSGDYQLGSSKETISGESETGDFEGLSERLDFQMPKTFILLQLNFGVKVEVYPNVCLQAEAGIWDGLILRFGAAYRF